MNKIVSYLWSHSGLKYNLEYKLVDENDVKNDKERVYSYINPDYKNVLLFYWKVGAGGLFLSNCLALSEHVYTLYPDLSSKINFLTNSLDNQNLFWNDIYLTPSIIEYDTPEHVHKNKYTIIFEHEPENVKLHLKYWNNMDVIYFINPDLFCKTRRMLKNYDGEVIRYSCQYIKNYIKKIIPRSISHFNSLNDDMQKNLKSIFSSNENINSFCFLENKKLFYVWDTNWYFSENCTIMKVKEIYDYLNFSDFNEDAVRFYYKKWISKLDQLREHEIPNDVSILNNKEYDDKPISSTTKKPYKKNDYSHWTTGVW